MIISEPWTACESSPCENGATCIDVNVDTFICMCRDRFFDTTCSSSKFIIKTRMHSSRMRTVRSSGRLSCHACPPCHAYPPAMHTPYHAPPTMHAPCHVYPLIHTHPCHVCPLPCMPPLPHMPLAKYAPPAIHANPIKRITDVCENITCRNYIADGNNKNVGGFLAKLFYDDFTYVIGLT